MSSAGGGGGGGEKGGQNHEDSLHSSRFHGVTNAPEIRDLILSRLRQFREAGLGDPDDAGSGHEDADIESTRIADSIGAAAELLNEVRALRQLAPVLKLPDR